MLLFLVLVALCVTGRLELERHAAHHGAGDHSILAWPRSDTCTRAMGVSTQNVLGHVGHPILEWDTPDLADFNGRHIVALVLDIKDHRGFVCLGRLPAIMGC